MKTHILSAILTALFLTACASHEGRKLASTQEAQKEEQLEQTQYSKQDANSGRDLNHQ